MSKNDIWDTKKVNETLEKMRRGDQFVQTGCFFERQQDLKNGNILFKYTPEEFEIIKQCKNDAVHFTEKYVKFLTDKGRSTVVLRDYQKDTLRAFTEEQYIPDLDDFGPVNRNIIMCQSRQTGKCSLNAQVIIRNKKTSEVQKLFICELYNLLNKKKRNFIYNWLEQIKIKLIKKI